MPYMEKKGHVDYEKNTYPQGKSGSKVKTKNGPAVPGNPGNPTKSGGINRATKG